MQSAIKVKVLYISGAGRSGSTILSNILGQIDGLFSAGEVHRLWDSGPVEDRVCGCGQQLIRCPIWSEVLKKALGGHEHIVTYNLTHLKRRGYQTRYLPRLLLPGNREWLVHRIGKQQLQALARVYQAMADVTHNRVIIDSSKYPTYAYVLDLLPELDVYLLHLVRDARAVAFSWGQYKLDPATGRPLGHIGPIKAAIWWDLWNLASEWLWRSKANQRYMRLRYEDFATASQIAIKNILQFLGERPNSLPFIGTNEVKLKIMHTVAGNPIRYNQGITQVEPDMRWRLQMDLKAKFIVTSLTWPILARYNYHIHRAQR